MSVIAARDLRNHTAQALERVAAGERVTVTVRGRAVAELVPVREPRPTFLAADDFLADLVQADSGLRDDLLLLGDETTDDLGPLA